MNYYIIIKHLFSEFNNFSGELSRRSFITMLISHGTKNVVEVNRTNDKGMWHDTFHF